MAAGDVLKAALTKAGLDAARESAEALTQALRDAEAAAAALGKRGPMTPQEAATAEVKRLAAETRKAAAEYNALARAQARLEASGERAAGQQSKAGTRKAAQDAAKDARERSARMRKGVADAAREQRADRARAEKEDERSGGRGGGGAPKDLRFLLKSAGIGKAAMGAMGAAGGLELSKLALGYRGMAMLGAIGQRTGMQIRQLFSGVDPMPVVRAADRFSQLFNKATATGKAISGVFSRVFNSLFGGVERAEPLFFAFAEGLVGGALQIEIAYYRARLALMPFTDAIEDAIGPVDGIRGAAMAGGIAIGVMTAYAVATAAPFLAGAAAVAVLTKQILDLKAAWDSANPGKVIEAATKIGGVGVSQVGALGQAAGGAIRGKLGLDGDATPVPAGNPAEARAAGGTTAAAYLAGIVLSLGAGTSAIAAAGAAAGNAINEGARGALKIKSPSVVGEETGGQYPAGLARGVERRAPEARAAMVRAALPPKGGAGAAGEDEGNAAPSVAASAFPAEALALLREIAANTRKSADGPRASRATDSTMVGIARALGVGLAGA